MYVYNYSGTWWGEKSISVIKICENSKHLFMSIVSEWRGRVIQSGNGGSSLRLLNATASDAGILQCNASNHHGYVFANLYLTVHGKSAL